jgi:hypothetical protein
MNPTIKTKRHVILSEAKDLLWFFQPSQKQILRFAQDDMFSRGKYS